MANSPYRRVSAKRPCRICGKPDWCSFTPDERVSFCARVTTGSDRISPTGWGVYFHDPLPEVISEGPRFPVFADRSRRAAGSAPIEARDFAYRKLIEMAPASGSTEILNGRKGLSRRRIMNTDNYGSLPKSFRERDELAEIILDMVDRKFPELLNIRKTAGKEIPGFWTDERGRPRLWRPKDYSVPMMLIPFQDAGGSIQACQIRFMFEADAKPLPRYVWLSTPERSGGSSTGSPIHFAMYDPGHLERPLLVTEGALKAETVNALTDGVDIIATAGVSCSHKKIIAAARFRPLMLGFDGDDTKNAHVARAVSKLLKSRIIDQELFEYRRIVRVLVWDAAFKGIDDALLNNIEISQVTPGEWFERLSPACRGEVESCLGPETLQAKEALFRGFL